LGDQSNKGDKGKLKRGGKTGRAAPKNIYNYFPNPKNDELRKGGENREGSSLGKIQRDVQREKCRKRHKKAKKTILKK